MTLINMPPQQLPSPPTSGGLKLPSPPPTRPPRHPPLTPSQQHELQASRLSPIDPAMQQQHRLHNHHTSNHPTHPPPPPQQYSDDILPVGGLPRRLDPSHSALTPSPSSPVFPVRQDSQNYQSLNAYMHSAATSTQHHHQQHQLQPTPPSQGQPTLENHFGMSDEAYEEMEDRRRMQQQILRDKLVQADRASRSRGPPDPSMTVKATSSTGFALGAFDMSESLAIVEDLLDYFGEDDLGLDEIEGAERFNESQVIEAERTHLERESLVRRLYDSEDDYLRSLYEIQTCYQKPMLQQLQQHGDTKRTGGVGGGLFSGSSVAVATRQEIEAVFGILDQLVEFHEDIRSLLEARSKIWGPTQIMSDLLISVIPRFRIYSKYFVHFHNALTVLDRISRTAPFKKFMEQCISDNPPGTASLHLMLAIPLHRLHGYRDMINALCQATQPNHPDYMNLLRALDMIHTVALELRDERLMAEDQLSLFDIQSAIVGLPEPIMIPHRRLILRADLQKVDSSLTLEPRTYYLTNDVLIYSRFDPKKNTHVFKGMFDLAKTLINNPEDNVTLPQLPNCLQIANSGRKQMIQCRSREERDYWMETLRKVIEVVNRTLAGDDNLSSTATGDVLPLRKYANSVASDSSSSLGHVGTTATNTTTGSSKGLGMTGGGGSSSSLMADSRSIMSKSSNDSSIGGGGGGSGVNGSKTRKPNPQADFYGCSFGTEVKASPNEDNYRPSPLALSQTISNTSSLSSSSSLATGSTGAGTSSTTTGMVSGSKSQSLGAILAAIPQEQLTPKQAKAKAALAAAVEARRQARLKQEMKSGSLPFKKEMNKNVNLDFSSSFIPAKERLAKS